jgi:1,4-dihydroxy-2-naphthoate octaprenyltransferase
MKYMGLGMLAIFIVIGVIVGITYLLNALFQEKNK